MAVMVIECGWINPIGGGGRRLGLSAVHLVADHAIQIGHVVPDVGLIRIMIVAVV